MTQPTIIGELTIDEKEELTLVGIGSVLAAIARLANGFGDRELAETCQGLSQMYPMPSLAITERAMRVYGAQRAEVAKSVGYNKDVVELIPNKDGVFQ